MASAMPIERDVLAVLSKASITEAGLVLPSEVRSGLLSAAKRALREDGWVYGRRRRAYTSPPPSESACMDRLLLSARADAPQMDFDGFETPPSIVKVLLALACIEPGHYVLEPSAGRGAIAKSIIARHPRSQVTCIAIPQENVKALLLMGFDAEVIWSNFFGLKPNPVFDRVVMCPPLSKQQDIDHVLHAYGFLAPGGLLVSVMSAGAKFREDRKAREFRAAIDEFGELQDLPDGSFKSSGTDVSTVVCVWRRPS